MGEIFTDEEFTMPGEDGKKHLVLRSYEKKAVHVPSGRYLTNKLNVQGNPYVVFCSNEHCEAYLYADGALPFWSEDCQVRFGVLRCPNCGAPVVRPDSPLDRKPIDIS